MIVAIVPAKDLTNAKQRLSPQLEPAHRRALFLAMLDDVLGAVSAAPSIACVTLVTREPELIRVAHRRGVDVFIEPANLGHTQAVKFAVERLNAREDVKAMLTIPGDVPLVTAAELETVVAASPEAPSVVLVPSRNGFGTNGVLLRPPHAMTLRFGEPSFQNHVRMADELGLAKRILRLPGLGLDVDTGADLELLRSRECGPSTQRILDQLSARGIFQPAIHHAH